MCGGTDQCHSWWTVQGHIQACAVDCSGKGPWALTAACARGGWQPLSLTVLRAGWLPASTLLACVKGSRKLASEFASESLHRIILTTQEVANVGFSASTKTVPIMKQSEADTPLGGC